jgi:hypothetical protein
MKIKKETGNFTSCFCGVWATVYTKKYIKRAAWVKFFIRTPQEQLGKYFFLFCFCGRVACGVEFF